MDILILGASARAAAFSALRAGFSPACGDLFADRDLIAACPVDPVAPADYPEGLADLAERLAPTRWLYTGGLENHPDLVDRISKRHVLLGNPGPILRAVRDPIRLMECSQAAGLRAPDVRIDPSELPTNGSWLVKPLASAGGRVIRPWFGGSLSKGRQVYFQERIDGLSLAALFIGSRAGTSCLGVTRQFVGKPGNRFAYRGTLAPWPVLDDVFDEIERLGRAIASEFHLSGIFGVDLILKDETPWPIEVNPRYTASVEALEWATGRSLLAEHCRVFGIDSPIVGAKQRAEVFVAKAIVHADRSFTWTEELVPNFDPSTMPEVADIPARGTIFEPGDPVLTVLTGGDSVQDCRRKLAGRIRAWRHRLSASNR